MAILTRIQNNQITDSTITYQKIVPGTLTGTLFNQNLTLQSNVTILGNLSVANSYAQLNSVNTYINDPLVVFNNNYTGSPTYDIGMLINRNLQALAGYGSVNTALIWEESAGQFQALATTETGTTTGVINNSGFANLRVGNAVAQTQTVSNSVSVGTTLSVTGNTTLGNVTTGNITHVSGATALTISGNTLTSNTGKIGLGSISNVVITGGSSGYAITTDGAGNLSFTAISTLGNAIQLGANTSGALVSNAVTLTTSTYVTDGIALLNSVLGKLVPQSPPAFPGSTPLTLLTATTAARITNFTQTDNALGNTYQAAAGTTVNAIRTSTYTTSNITAVGPGDAGTITVYWNGQAAGANALVAGGNTTVSNLKIGNNMDYNSVVSTVTAGFWRSFNTYATGTALPGWNTVLINDSYNSANTNPVLFYYDSTTVAGPTWSNATTAGTNAVLTSNVVQYSSSIPHLTATSVLRLKANVANLSGDMYYTSDTFITGTAGGAWQAPTSVAYSGLTPAPATPLVRNLYASSGSAYLETPSSLITTGFGSSSTGPSLTAFNGYSSTAQAFTTALGVTVLYKNGYTTQIEEVSIPVNSVGTGSGNGFRVASQGSTNNPVYTAGNVGSPIWNGQTTVLQTYDATNVGSAAAGVLKYDVTNYATGYYPVGPNLSSGRATTQYFTMKFIRTAVSKFDIKYTGTIAGLWVALPGVTPNGTDTYASPTNGWLDVSTAYAGSGIPGTGTGGNGSAGCAVGGNAVLNSAQTNLSVTATFGTLSSTNSTNNEIWVRVAFTSGQSLTALTIETATH